MDGGHSASEPVPSRHIITLDWYRIELLAALALSPCLDLEFGMPYDIKDQRVRYALPDGMPYDNPIGPFHHRTETLEGPGDLRLLANFRVRSILPPNDILHIGAGFTIPTGKTENKPLFPGDPGPLYVHQHIQFGTGTVDPLLRLGYRLQPDWWGIEFSAGAQIPLYENPRGYQGSAVIDFSIGPRFQLASGLSGGLYYAGIYQSRSYWDGRPDENSGYFQQAIIVRAHIRFSSSVMLVPIVMYTFDVQVMSGADVFQMDWFFGISLEVSPSINW